MRKLFVVAGLAITTVAGAGQAKAADTALYWNLGNAPYWPAFRATEYAGENCVRWNWQELSYYNYCGDAGRFVRPARTVVRVRG